MSDKKDSRMSEEKWQEGREWHLEFTDTPGMPCPVPIVPAGTRAKHDAVGHLCTDDYLNTHKHFSIFIGHNMIAILV